MNAIEYSYESMKKMRTRTEWEEKHLSCELSFARVEIKDPREMKKPELVAPGCDGVCTDPPQGENNGNDSLNPSQKREAKEGNENDSPSGDGKKPDTQGQPKPAQGQPKPAQGQPKPAAKPANAPAKGGVAKKEMALIELKAQDRSNGYTFLEVSERTRCGCYKRTMGAWPSSQGQPSSSGSTQSTFSPDDAIAMSSVNFAAAKQVVGSTDSMPTGESIIRDQSALEQQEQNMLRTNQ
jgi:hypothetical protein